jgi:succinate dehydrogenase / fumarate reductase flavoprotein subunit
MWNKVGMGRTPEGLREAIKEIEEVRKFLEKRKSSWR